MTIPSSFPESKVSPAPRRRLFFDIRRFIIKRPQIDIKIAPIGLTGWLRILFLLLAIYVIGDRLYSQIFHHISADNVGNTLSSLSVTGSIITGLCLTGVSAMEGNLLKRLTRTYGDHLRSVFFTWFTFVNLVLIASTVLRAVPDTTIARMLASYMPPILFVAVTGLAYSVFKLYRIEEEVDLGIDAKDAASDKSDDSSDDSDVDADAAQDADGDGVIDEVEKE